MDSDLQIGELTMNSSCNVSNTFVVAAQTNPSVACNNNNISQSPGDSAETATWWMMLLVLLLIGTTIVANLVIILLFIVDKKIRTPFNYIILNIAVGDAAIGIFDMPQFAASYFYWGFWPFSEAQCSFWMFLDYFLPAVTMSSIAALSVDRFWAVLNPTVYREYHTNRKALIIILITWFLAFAGVVPGYTYSRLYFSDQSQNKSCLWDVEGEPMWTSFFQVVLNVWMPFLVALICYVGTVFKLVKIRLSRTAVDPVRTNNYQILRKERQERQERQAFTVVTLLALSLFISYSPWITYLVRLTLLKYENPPMLYNAAFWMSYSLSMVNPFVCSAGSRDMENALKRLCGFAERVPAHRRGNAVSVTTRQPANQQSTV